MVCSVRDSCFRIIGLDSAGGQDTEGHLRPYVSQALSA